ncbi:helix-turn-helix transcriptional regulator [Stackebrandtia albiflava]
MTDTYVSCHTVAMTTGSPTIARRVLGTSLRNHRESRRITRTTAGAAIGYAHQTIQRIEEGTQATREHQVRGLCQLYGVPEDEIAELCRYAKEGAKRGWWESYKEGMPPEFRAFAETEAEIAAMHTVELEHVPGIIQTDGYLRAAQTAALPFPEEKLRAVRRLRQLRQERLFRRDPLPELHIVLGQSALLYLRRLGDVGDEQLRRIRDVAALPTADVRVAVELHPAMACSFTILTPGPPLPGAPFVFIDAVHGGRYEEGRDVVSLYERTFAAAHEMAIPVEEYIHGW